MFVYCLLSTVGLVFDINNMRERKPKTKKLMKECKDVDDVIKLVAMEQLLETLPTGLASG